ncbi:MAG: hypothetical protein V1871_08680 [Planctomycetota bacterium]
MLPNKALYLIIGILLGIIVMVVVKKIPAQEISAAPLKQTETVANQDYIAIAATTKTDTNIVWLIDTANKKLLLYEYFNENVIKLKAVRDIRYDLDIPDGLAIPANRKDADPQPLDVKKLYDEIRKSK